MCAASRLPAPFALLALSARRYSAALSWPLLVALFGTADTLKGIVPVADPCAPSHGQSTGVTTIFPHTFRNFYLDFWLVKPDNDCER